MRRRPIPITAHAVVCGLGASTEACAAAQREGRDGLRPCPVPLPYPTMSGVVPGELPPSSAPYRSRHLELSLLAFEELRPALERARDRWGAERIALIVATSTGGIRATEEAYFAWRESGQLPTSYDFDEEHPFCSFAEHLCGIADLRGPRYVVSTACSSSGKVFAAARRLMRLGMADAVLVGGVDSLCLTTLRGFHGLGVLSAEPCRPFGADRPGMNIGEGAAFQLLEREALEGCVGELLGVGESSDAFHMSAPEPGGRGALAAMRGALADAACAPQAVDYISAHGTGTAANDGAEAKAIEALFGRDTPVFAPKSYTGHTLGAAGAVEASLALLSIRDGLVPASLRVEDVDPEVRIRLQRQQERRPIQRVLSNSFAFGGSNVAVLLGGPR
ncbi:MAG: beta-ketoacyl-ACP synthase [Myxococcales bacterium]|nr:beta-ketoacyl-ACP synthase [Myxococcales bacterium]